MPRKPIIQTVVATTIAISGSSQAGAETDQLDRGPLDVIGTDFPDDTHFFVGDDIDILTFGADEDLIFAQEKPRQRTRERVKTAPPVRDTARQKPAKVPQNRSRTDVKPETARTAPSAAKLPDRVGVEACCTVYALR